MARIFVHAFGEQFLTAFVSPVAKRYKWKSNSFATDLK